MATLNLVANPTFKAKVGVPRAGEQPVDVNFTFKHRTREAFAEFTEALPSAPTELIAAATSPDGKKALNAALIELDVDYVLDVASGWELTYEFNRDNIRTLLQNYHGTAAAIATTYTRELMQAKRGN